MKDPVEALTAPELNLPSPPTVRPADWRWFWAIVGLAAVLRMGYFTGHVKTVFFSHPILDARVHHETATLSAERVEGRETSTFQSPVYPTLLSFLYRVLNAPIRLTFVYLLQHAMGLLTVALVFVTAYRAAGRGPALGASFLAATYGPLAAYSNDALPVALMALEYIALAYLLIEAATARGVLNQFLAGCVFCVAVYTYGGLWLFLPVALVRLWAIPPPRPVVGAPFRAQGDSLLQSLGRWANPLVFLAPVCLGVAFYALVTAAHTGQATFAPWGGGVYAYFGNGPAADGVFIRAYERDDTAQRGAVSALESYARRRYPREITVNTRPWEIGAYWYGETARWIARRPLRWVSLMAKKTLLVFNQASGSNHVSYRFFREINPFARFWPSTFGIILLCAIVGLRATGKIPWSWPRHWVWILAVCQGAVLVLFLVEARERVALVPVVCLMSGIGVQLTWRYLKRPSRQRAFVRYGAPMGAILAVWIFVDWFGVTREGAGRDWWRYGRVAYEAGRFETAAMACDRALAMDERSVPLYLTRGDLFAQDNRTTEALAEYEKAILFHPEDSRPYYAVAQIHQEQGDYATAVGYLKAALERAPNSADYLADYGMLALRAGDLREAFEHLHLAYNWAPNNVTAIVGLAECARRRADEDEFLKRYQQAMELDTGAATLARDLAQRPIPPEAIEAPAFRLERRMLGAPEPEAATP